MSSAGLKPFSATLRAEKPAGIHIRADDGHILAQGERQAGLFEFSFSSRAEIIIDDGIKVEPDYADWPHCPVGASGSQAMQCA